MRAARMACTVAGTSMLASGRDQPVASALPASAPASTRLRTLSSRKNGLPSVRSMSSCLSGCSSALDPEQALEQVFGRLGGQRVEPKLGVVGLARPRDGGTRAGS